MLTLLRYAILKQGSEKVDRCALDEKGFWDLERNEQAKFRWTKAQFSIAVPDFGSSYVTLLVASELPHNTLRVFGPAGKHCEIPLLRGWQRIDVATIGATRLDFEVALTFVPGPQDLRVLGIMVLDFLFHADSDRHRKIAERHLNAVRNEAEYRAGLPEIASVPPYLRITSSKTCNIANEKACVYCAWDSTKQLEKDSPDQGLAFLSRLGHFINLASVVTDCSYGEPPLEKEFEQIVDLLTDTERTFEFTTNGQSLSAKNRAKLLGKTALVHVSIDSASAAGYRRYRDHRFDLIIENLRALCRDKALTGNLPTVSVSFIVMRSNREEIKDFLRLMKDVGVDRVAFRNLYRDEPMSGQTTKHYGFKFDYDKECLSRAELEALGSICLIIGKTIGIPVILEWKDFANNTAAAATNVPLCSEPWKAAYLLNRGIMPCCYGRVPLIKWTELDLSNPEASLREAVNAQAFQELRRDLAAGELGTYCEQCHSCPIVQAHRKAASTASDRVEARFMRD